MTKKKEKKRSGSHLDMAFEEAVERLKSLSDKTEATSFAEVIKNALRIFEAMVEEAERGNELYVKDTDGKEIAYRMLF